MSENSLYRVTGDYDGKFMSFRVVARSPEHADQRIREFFDGEDDTVHKGIELETALDRTVVGYASGRLLFCRDCRADDMTPFSDTVPYKTCATCSRSIFQVYAEQVLER